MVNDRNERFTPEHIDEQIEQYHVASIVPAHGQSGARTVQILQRYYEPEEDAQQSLDRVWQKFVQRRAERGRNSYGMPKLALRLVEKEQNGACLPVQPRIQPGSPPVHRLAMIAAVVFAALLVGSMLAVFQMARHSGTTGRPSGVPASTPPNVDAGEIYVSANDVLYRLNPGTYQPMWRFQMHPTRENVYSQVAGQAINHVYYFWGTDRDSYYYYALNTSNGSLRWRFKLPGSAQLGFTGNQLIVHGVVYISEASLTQGYSLVIALDASTGHQLWQHRYNNTGITLGEKHSTDYATGLQLEAVSNGMLFAASSTSKNGSATRLLYALSSRDGSIVWQRSSATKEQVDEVMVDNNTLFLATWYSDGDHNLAHMNAYDTVTGNLLWSVPLDGQGDSLTAYDGYVFIETITPPATGRNVYVLNERNGTVSYQKYIALGTGNSSVTISQGVVYLVAIANERATLTMIHPLSRKSPVTYSIPSSVSIQIPPVIQHNPVTGEVLIYVSVASNQANVLRGTDGKVMRTFTLGRPIYPPVFDYVLVTVIP